MCVMTRKVLQDALAVSLPEAAHLLGVSARTIAALVAAGELPSCRVGRRRVIPTQALQDFLKGDHQTARKDRT